MPGGSLVLPTRIGAHVRCRHYKWSSSGRGLNRPCVLSRDCLSHPIPLNVDHGSKRVQRWGSPAAEGEVALVARFCAQSGVRRWAMTSLSGVIVSVSVPVFSGKLKAGGSR